MGKVLFLDIDGVLNTGWLYTQMDRNTPKDKYGYVFDPRSVANLKKIVDETGADIVESKKVVTYEDFVKYLVEFKVKYALYLDMGSGWNYAWYRDKGGKVIEQFPESKKSPNYKYRTNWITFYK